jgi:hypothetical protein
MSDPQSPFFEWVKENKQMLLLVGLLALFVQGLTGGCSAHRIGERLIVNERSVLNEPPLPYSVAVVPWTTDESKQKRLQKGKKAAAF